MSITFNHIDLEKLEPLVYFQLDKSGFRPPLVWTLEDWIKVKSSKYFVFNLEDDLKKVIGFAIFDISIEEQFSHLLKITLSENYRKKGHSSWFLKLCIDFLKKRQINKVYLEVKTSNISALKLYKSLSFNILHTKESYYSDGSSATIMEKIIC